MSTPTQPGELPTDDLLERFEAWKDQASEADEPIPTEFAELAAGGALLRETLNHEIDAVPDAAFAAMWSRVEAQIEEQAEPWWSRALQRWTRGWRLPVGAMAGACGVALVWIVVQPELSSSQDNEMRSAQLPAREWVAQRAAEPSASAKASPAEADAIAQGNSTPGALIAAKSSAPSKGSTIDAASRSKAARSASKRRVAAVAGQASSALELAANQPQEEKEPSESAKSSASSDSDGQGIERIDFARGGGRIGTIERPRGTTTVVWIDASPRASADGPAMDL